MNGPLRNMLGRIQAVALAIGLAALAACALGAAAKLPLFFESYLVGFLFWMGIALGSAGLLMIHKLTGGRWGEAITWPLTAGVRTLPMVTLLFIPVAVAVWKGQVFYWADPRSEWLTEMTAHQKQYLSAPFVLVRAGLYFAIWLLGGFLLTRWTDASRLRRLSAGGLILLVLTVTFAAFDWIMSLQPGWHSTIYGMLVLVGHLVAALSTVTVVVIVAAHLAPVERKLSPDALHDLGNLLLMAVSLWAYISFSQFLIIYYTNLPEEVRWYVAAGRTRYPWKAVAIALIAFHFAVPLLVLLARQSKRNAAVMLTLALGLLAMHFADTLWLVVPSVNSTRTPETVMPAWAPVMYVAAAAGVGGLWVATFARQLRRLAPVAARAEGGTP